MQPEDWDRKLDSQRSAQELGTTWNRLEPCFHSFHFVSFVSFVSLANHSPSRHCPRLHQDSVILLADDDDAVPCEISAKAGKTCLFTCVYVYIISYDYICVYVVINNRHRYIA